MFGSKFGRGAAAFAPSFPSLLYEKVLNVARLYTTESSRFSPACSVAKTFHGKKITADNKINNHFFSICHLLLMDTSNRFFLSTITADRRRTSRIVWITPCQRRFKVLTFVPQSCELSTPAQNLFCYLFAVCLMSRIIISTFERIKNYVSITPISHAEKGFV